MRPDENYLVLAKGNWHLFNYAHHELGGAPSVLIKSSAYVIQTWTPKIVHISWNLDAYEDEKDWLYIHEDLIDE